DLFVQHPRRQTEGGNVGAHQAARRAVLLEDRHLVTERHQVVGHRERGATGADAGDALAVLQLGYLGEQAADIVSMVGGDTLQPADRHRLALDASASAGGVTGAGTTARRGARETL